MSTEKEYAAQMTFDFGFKDGTEESAPEVVDLGDAEESSGLPPSAQDGEESLSFSSPDEESTDEESMDDGSSDEESVVIEDMEGVDIITDDAPEGSSDDEKESQVPSPAPENTAEEIREKEPKKPVFDSRNVKRAALAFLASLKPDGLAMDVPVRYRKYTVDAAAFWTEPAKNGKGVCRTVRTAVAEVAMNVEDIGKFHDKNILSVLAAARQELSVIESAIRLHEPELKERASLFGDDVKWDYTRSRNPAHKICLARIRELELKLFRGSRFDKLRKSEAASEFYLVVPENMIPPSGIAEEWGLVYVLPDLSFRLIRKAGLLPCSEQNMNQLSMNIGRRAMENVLFANGIVRSGDEFKLTRLPRKRRI